MEDNLSEMSLRDFREFDPGVLDQSIPQVTGFGHVLELRDDSIEVPTRRTEEFDDETFATVSLDELLIDLGFE